MFVGQITVFLFTTQKREREWKLVTSLPFSLSFGNKKVSVCLSVCLCLCLCASVCLCICVLSRAYCPTAEKATAAAEMGLSHGWWWLESWCQACHSFITNRSGFSSLAAWFALNANVRHPSVTVHCCGPICFPRFPTLFRFAVWAFCTRAQARVREWALWLSLLLLLSFYRGSTAVFREANCVMTVFNCPVLWQADFPFRGLTECVLCLHSVPVMPGYLVG